MFGQDTLADGRAGNGSILDTGRPLINVDEAPLIVSRLEYLVGLQLQLCPHSIRQQSQYPSGASDTDAAPGPRAKKFRCLAPRPSAGRVHFRKLLGTWTRALLFLCHAHQHRMI